MGKNLKGRECGKGIYQRKDGKYSARYYAKDGKRKEKYFNTLPEAKNWLADAKYEDRHNLIVADPKMTVDKWSFTGSRILYVVIRSVFVSPRISIKVREPA